MQSEKAVSQPPWISGLLGVWFVGMVMVGAGLLARHTLALPAPEHPGLPAHLAQLRTNGPGFLAVHVLNSECRCSQRIAEHLTQGARPAGWEEVVLWTGEGAPPSVLQERFHLVRVSPEELASYGVEAAPVLIALSPEDRVLYSGGYTDRKQGPVIRDGEILTALSHAGHVSTLPVFGCASSQRLKGLLARLPSF